MRKLVLLSFMGMLFLVYGCKLEEISSKLGTGIRKEINKVRLDSLLGKATQKGVKKGLNQLFADSLHQKIQAELAPILGQLSDSLETTVDKSIRKALGEYTEERLDLIIKKQSDQLSKTLVNTTDSLIAHLLGQATQAQVRTFLRKALFDELDAYVAQLIGQASDPANKEKLTLLRQNISVQLDSLIGSALVAASAGYDKNFSPKADSLVAQITGILSQGEQFGKTTKKSASSLIWQIVGGLAGLVLLIGLAVFWVNAYRYKQMLKVITKQINEIPNQEVYDKLTGEIKQTLDGKGLNRHLNQILKEQELNQQPEWEDKDKQVLRLITAYLTQLEKSDKDVDNVLPEIQAQARNLGIEEHFNSVLKRMGG